MTPLFSLWPKAFRETGKEPADLVRFLELLITRIYEVAPSLKNLHYGADPGEIACATSLWVTEQIEAGTFHWPLPCHTATTIEKLLAGVSPSAMVRTVALRASARAVRAHSPLVSIYGITGRDGDEDSLSSDDALLSDRSHEIYIEELHLRMWVDDLTAFLNIAGTEQDARNLGDFIGGVSRREMEPKQIVRRLKLCGRRALAFHFIAQFRQTRNLHSKKATKMAAISRRFEALRALRTRIKRFLAAA